VAALTLAAGASAYPPIAKSEARAFGGNPDPLAPNDASGAGSLGRESCVTTGEPGSVPGVDKDVSCDDTFAPDNENGIVVHPEDERIILGGSNDYQLFFNGNTVVQRVPAGYFLSFDSGRTWIDGQVPMQASFGAGDPSPAFDVKRNKALMASLSFVCGQGAPQCSRGNLAVAELDLAKARAAIQKNPKNPNLPWSDQMVVKGSAADFAAVQIFSDKEWLVVDNNRTSPHFGNYYLVWARFRSEHGAYDESPIFFTKSEDGGRRWTDPVEISGRSVTYCKFQDDPEDSADTTGDSNPSGVSETPDDPNACDQDQFAYPAVAPNGDLYVHFHNEQHLEAYEPGQNYDSQIMIVKSNDGGDTWSGNPNPAEQAGCVPNPLAADAAIGTCIVPIHVVDLEDSYDEAQEEGPQSFTADYPINVDGRTTLTNQQFRVNSAGTIAIGRQNGGTPSQYRVLVVFADNCAGVRPGVPAFVASVEPVTDTNVYYAYSDDGGATWQGGDVNNGCGSGLAGSGRLIASNGIQNSDDQWFPWVAANPVTGAFTAVAMDASQFDGATRETYGFTGATSQPTTLGVPPAFGPEFALAGAASDPRHSRFFRAVAPTCFDCSLFIGDYNGVDVDRQGRIHAMWTDMRRPIISVDRPEGCDADPATPAPPCVPTPLFGQDAYYAQRPTTP
jgi:hypothetical protein